MSESAPDVAVPPGPPNPPGLRTDAEARRPGDPTDEILADGYVVQTSASPAAASGGLRAVPPEIPGGLAFQNLSYALQWWLFSAFGLFFWWRLVRDDHRGTLHPPEPPAAAGPPVGDDETVPTPDAADAGERP